MASLSTFIAIILLSLGVMFPMPSVVASSPTTYVSVINPDTGDNTFIFPPETPINSTFLVNMTVTEVENLAGWQLNLTWDPTLLKISKTADIYLPPGHIFTDLDARPAGLQIDNVDGEVFWIVAIGPDSPVNNYNGSGVMCQIKFTIKANVTAPLSCDLIIDTASIFPTYLLDPDANELPFQKVNGNYDLVPEFPLPALLLIFLIIISVVTVLTKKTWLIKTPKIKSRQLNE